MTTPGRRQADEGGISEYPTKAGTRYLIKYGYTRPDGSKAVVLKRGYLTRRAAAAGLREQLSNVDRGTHVARSKVTVGGQMGAWLDGLRREPSTVASYRKNVRLHVEPTIGALRLGSLAGGRLTRLYVELEQSGRVDGKGGLSPRTVLYIHTIIHSALTAAWCQACKLRRRRSSAHCSRAPTPDQLRAAKYQIGITRPIIEE